MKFLARIIYLPLPKSRKAWYGSGRSVRQINVLIAKVVSIHWVSRYFLWYFSPYVFICECIYTCACIYVCSSGMISFRTYLKCMSTWQHMYTNAMTFPDQADYVYFSTPEPDDSTYLSQGWFWCGSNFTRMLSFSLRRPSMWISHSVSCECVASFSCSLGWVSWYEFKRQNMSELTRISFIHTVTLHRKF